MTLTFTVASLSKRDFIPPGMRWPGFGGDLGAFWKVSDETEMLLYVKVVYVKPNPKGKRGVILWAWKYR